MVDDVLQETQSRIQALNPESPEDIRIAGRQMVAFSEDMYHKVEALRKFLYTRMYRHYTVNRVRVKVTKIVQDLFASFLGDYELLPPNWQERVIAGNATDDSVDGKQARARIVLDYIAGMTDRYAIREHERLFDLYWDLR
jgi:dGTPase